MSSPDPNKVYWQDEAFVHIEDEWIGMGARMASSMEIKMRDFNGMAGWEGMKPLCPACYMLTGYNMLVLMAMKNGQSLEELQASMIGLFESMDMQNPMQTSLHVTCELPDNSGCEEETG